MKYKAYSLRNLDQISQLEEFTEPQVETMKVISNVLPFKTNNYVIEHLIDWTQVPNDPIFKLTFPQGGMLQMHHFYRMQTALHDNGDIKKVADSIRMELNPHPAGQMEKNIPELNGDHLLGIQHKYDQTVLFFPKHGQTCHAYCSFCFRWPQFVNMDKKFAMKEVDILIDYVQHHPEVTDILFTGGDPMVMKAKLLEQYIRPIIDANIPHLRTIRMGSKTLSYWPFRYTTDEDSENVLSLFSDVVESGLNFAFMAHFNHWQELQTPEVVEAAKNIRNTGTQIRTQSPILKHINDESSIWTEMWKRQVDLGMIPYYMFIVRDTGAQHYFATPLMKAWKIFHNAYNQVSGIARTVRGPSMSTSPGKVEIVGPSVMMGQKVIVLRFIQGRNPEWVGKPFFAKYDPNAIWLDELQPIQGNEFFYQNELPDHRNVFYELELVSSEDS